MDIRNAIEALGLERASLLGHSMGCSVIWCYIDLFGQEGLERLVLVDQMPSITARSEWSEQEKQDAGAIFDGASLYETIGALAGNETVWGRPRASSATCSPAAFPPSGWLGSSNRIARCRAATRPPSSSITLRRTGAT